MRALIHADRVVQLAEEEFLVHSSLIWKEAPEGCEVGWSYADGEFAAPEPGAPPVVVDPVGKLFKVLKASAAISDQDFTAAELAKIAGMEGAQ